MESFWSGGFEIYRGVVFLGLLMFFAIAAWCWPLSHKEKAFKAHFLSARVVSNLGLIFLGQVFLKWVLPVTAVGFSLYVESRGWGLFGSFPVPLALELVLGVLVLDLAIYLQHFLFHRVPILWRLHRVHHTDTILDVTTAVRFHPLEIGLSMLFKFWLIGLMGLGPWTVLLFEVLLSSLALFNHSNLNLGAKVERVLQVFLVTPGMHRVHHSVEPTETHSNFGFNLSFWDHSFRTFRFRQHDDLSKVKIGLPRWRSLQDSRLDQLLVLPFRSDSRTD